MTTLQFEMVQAPTHIEFSAGASGRLLRFSGARLARAEMNKNRDRITPTGIAELAATVAGTAIDVEHESRNVCGIFTAGAAIEDPELGHVLEVSGLVHADRFPEMAAGIQSGTHGLSIEADGAKATCSVCGGIFGSSSVYCDHLQNKFRSGAERTVEGLVALGGGIVRSPAGNGTDFSKAAIKFVASQADPQPEPAPIPTSLEAFMKTCPYCKNALSAAVDKCPKCEHSLAADVVASDLATAMAQLETIGAEKETATAQVATLTASVTELTAAKTAADTARQAAQDSAAAATAKLRRAALAGRISDADWTAKSPTLLAMTDEQFELMLSLAPATVIVPAPKQPAPAGGIALGAGDESTEDDGKFTIVLRAK